MAETSDYEKQLRETSRLVAQAAGFDGWDSVFQSRSGPPNQPWLGPDILEHLRRLRSEGVTNVLAAPLGFVSDHLEVLYDLDVEAAALAGELGMKFIRAATVGTHPAFVRMIRQLMLEPSRGACPEGCCPAPLRAGRVPASEAASVSRQF